MGGGVGRDAVGGVWVEAAGAQPAMKIIMIAMPTNRMQWTLMFVPPSKMRAALKPSSSVNGELRLMDHSLTGIGVQEKR
jgi:hypothetical protein